MNEAPVVLNIAIVLIFALFGGFIFHRFKQPPILGYIVSGLVLGTLLSHYIHENRAIIALAEMGVAFLMFTIGIEFSLSRFRRIPLVVIGAGITQIIATTLASFVIFQFTGFSLFESLFIGVCFSLSSTAVVVKILTDKGDVDTLQGEILVAWLLIQDLSVLPIIIILPAIGVGLQNFSIAGAFSHVGIGILKAVILLSLIILIGKRIVPKLLDFVGRTKQQEFLGLTIAALALAIASTTQMFGLSLAVGAFIAGILVADTLHKNAIFSEIKPLRNLFSIVFFVSLGLIFPFSFFLANVFKILGLTILVMILKFSVVLVLTLYMGYHSKTSFLVGVGLIQVGEFAFILAREGISASIISSDTYATILAVAFLTILLFPPIFFQAPALYTAVKRRIKHKLPRLYTIIFSGFDRRPGLDELPVSDHIVLCGYGRVGRYIGRALSMAQIPFVVVDYNQSVVYELQEKGERIVYGDPADIDVLDFAQVEKAKAVIIAIPDRFTQELIITNSQTLNKNIQIICRTHHEEDQKSLKSLGVSVIVQPEFEAAISITRNILQKLKFSEKEIDGKIVRLKIEHGMGDSSR